MIRLTFRPTFTPYGSPINVFAFLQDQYDSVEALVADIRANLAGFIGMTPTADSQIIVWRESTGYRHMRNSGIHWEVVS